MNPPQREAVEAPDGPLLIFAGAGSGKTRVLTHRIAYVIATRRVRPDEICAVTFTNKAAREMRARVEQLIGDSIKGMWLGTFHSLGARLLRREGEAIGIPPGYTIYDEADRLASIRNAIRAEGIDEKRLTPSRAAHAISAAKNELLDARDFQARVTPNTMDEQIARIYWAYERELDAASALDFDDLLLRAVTLFREAESVREYYQDRFLHLFVDEYQDTNKAQYELVKILGAKHRNVTVVGDDDQSVYGFRGADVRNILSFEHDFPDAKTVTLEQNYRSTQPILDIAHSVIRNNSERAQKKLWTEQSIGEPVRLISVYDEREEALAVASEIENLIGREGAQLAECAVLYRTNAQSRAFEEAFLRRGIPYQLVGGLRFYDRREVKDVLAYLRLCVNPRDAVSFARVVNTPRRKIGDRSVAELEKLARKKGLAPLEAAQRLDDGGDQALGPAAMTALRGFADLMERLSLDAQRVPLTVLLERVLDETGYREMLQDGTQEGAERWANVLELAGLAAEYSDVPPPDGLDAIPRERRAGQRRRHHARRGSRGHAHHAPPGEGARVRRRLHRRDGGGAASPFASARGRRFGHCRGAAAHVRRHHARAPAPLPAPRVPAAHVWNAAAGRGVSLPRRDSRRDARGRSSGRGHRHSAISERREPCAAPSSGTRRVRTPWSSRRSDTARGCASVTSATARAPS